MAAAFPTTDTTPAPHETLASYIYVSQGRCARISKSTNLLDIKGIVTDGFSTCNILAIKSATKLTLIHVDMSVQPQPLVDAYSWHKDDGAINLMLIKRDIELAHITEKNIAGLFADIHTGTVEKHEVGLFDGDAVCVAFDTHPSGGSSLNSFLHLYPRDYVVPGLLRHPQEYVMTDYLKVNHLLSPRTTEFKETFVIFDNGSWQKLNPQKDLDWHPEIKRTGYIDALKPEMPYVEVTSHVMGFIVDRTREDKLIMLSEERLKSEAMDLSFTVYGLFNKYQYERLLRQDLQDILEGAKPIITDGDGPLVVQLTKLLKLNPNETINAIEHFDFDRFADTEFRRELRGDFSSLARRSKHYREAFHQPEILTHVYKEIDDENLKGAKLSEAADYAGALSHFERCLDRSLKNCIISDKRLQLPLWNYFSTLVKLPGSASDQSKVRQTYALCRIVLKPEDVKKASEKFKTWCTHHGSDASTTAKTGILFGSDVSSSDNSAFATASSVDVDSAEPHD